MSIRTATLFILLLTNLYCSEARFIADPYENIYKTQEELYAKNIWDMQLYKEKIYIGGGNSSNKGPAINAGRVKVYSLDINNDEIKDEYTVAEEQIDLIKVYDGILYIPGHDATQKWDFGNFYTLSLNKWKKHRTIPDALHVYDIIKKDDILYTALGMYGSGGLGVSYDNGKTWSIKKTPSRIYSLLNLNKIYTDDTLVKKPYKITRVKNIQDSIIYIQAKIHNDHQSKPLKVIMANLLNKKIQTKTIKLPNKYIPRDILVDKKHFYILVSEKNSSWFNVKVLKFNYDDVNSYEEILEFRSPTFARSFEKSKNNFYFGLGCEINNAKDFTLDELHHKCGDILKYTLEK